MFPIENLIKVANEIAEKKIDTDVVTVVCSERMAEILRNSGIEFANFVTFYDGNLVQIGKKDNFRFYLSKYLPPYVACDFWTEKHPEIKTIMWGDKVES